MIIVCHVAFAQKDYSTITIYRPANFMMSAVKTIVTINGTDIEIVKNGGKLEYKLFSDGQTTVEVRGHNEFNKQTQVRLSVTKGNSYYLELHPVNQITTGYFQIDRTKSLDDKKLKSKNYVSASELDYEQNERIYYHPRTEWSKESLITHWESNGTTAIEGIYEKVGNRLEYNLAVLKWNTDYQIIYLSGANGTSWNEGDIKATLQKTAQFGLFKSNWYMLNKSSNKDVIVTFEKATMKTISETGNGDDLYLKIYPTYDEDDIVSNSNDWKSTGTGFFIDISGYIATNYHVVENSTDCEVEVTTNGTTNSYKATIISSDRQNDLAILKISNSSFRPLEAINYNFHTKIQDVGSSVYSLGYPLTQILGNEIKFADGRISSKSGFQGDITTYQITVPIQPGNSGGPLFDEIGNLVGIVSSGINKQLADNTNYAIKTSYMQLLIDSTDDYIELPKSTSLVNKPLTEQIKILSDYVVLIRVK
ncbi:MAG: serine protease [Cyclobacteriaceae bacterium]